MAITIAPISTLVRDYKPGMVITEPGIYRGVPMSAYHCKNGVEICDAPSVSSSTIRKIVGSDGCLLKCWDEYHGNPKRKPPKAKTYFSFGRALHHLAGGEAQFSKQFAVRPLVFPDWRTDAAKEWRARAEAAKLDVLTPEDLEALQACTDQLMAHPNVQNGILRGLVEHSIFFKVRVPLVDGGYLDLWVKVRPDVIPVDGLMVTDLKSAADASPIGARRAITDNGYHVQMAMIQEALLAITGQLYDELVLLFIESSRPHPINHKPLGAFDIMAGRMLFRKGLSLFANAYATNTWPTYDDDEVPGGLLDYAAKAIAKQIEDGELPPIEPFEMAPTGQLALADQPQETF